MFALPYRWVTQIAFISANNPYSGKGPQFRFFYVVKGGEEKKKGGEDVSLRSARSWLPSAQDHPPVRVVHLGGGLPLAPTCQMYLKGKLWGIYLCGTLGLASIYQTPALLLSALRSAFLSSEVPDLYPFLLSSEWHLYLILPIFGISMSIWDFLYVLY